MSLLQDEVIPALNDARLPVLRPPDRPDVVVSPIPLDETLLAQAALVVMVNETTRDVLLRAEICEVPDRRRTKLAWLLNDLNDRMRFVRWCLHEGKLVVVEHDVDLSGGGNRRRAVLLALLRVLTAVEREWRPIIRAVHARSSLSRLERQVAQIIARTS
jgi:hypothetical protein